MGITLTTEVDYDEIVHSCSRRDKELLLTELLKLMDKDIINSIIRKVNSDPDHFTWFTMPGHEMTFMESDFNEALLILSRKYLSVTTNDQRKIEEIAKYYE